MHSRLRWRLLRLCIILKNNRFFGRNECFIVRRVIECRHQYTCFLSVLENLFIWGFYFVSCVKFKECPSVSVLLFVESLQRDVVVDILGDVFAKDKICTFNVL